MELPKHAHSSNPALTVPLGQPLPPPPSIPKKKRSKPPPAVHLLAGGLGGMCGSVVTAPFDVVKTRLQSDMFQQQRSTKVSATSRSGIRALLYNFVDTGIILKEVYKHEGPTALFKGLGPTLAGVVPGRSINFFVYGNGKHLYAEWFNDGKENTAVHLASAASAGIVTAAATNPIWVIKTVMQLQQQERSHSPSSSRPSPTTSSSTIPSSSRSRPLPAAPPHSAPSPHFSHSFRSISSPPLPLASPPPRPTSYSTAIHIYRTEGIRGFYKGLSASLLGVTEGTIQWSLYEQFKRIAAKTSPRTTGGNEPVTEGWRVSVAAGMAKLVATVITYPHEVIRTRLRQPPPASGSPKYTSLVQSFKLVLREEGWKALYGGMSPHLLRVVPNAVTMFWVYERVLNLAEQRMGIAQQLEEDQARARD
ncbi:Rim2p [Sporobolomyces salmoneus]|uniref:Rim2p n=1 Tax=Sporobolomyces salmoneus TaxID=183962 RepID=UPI0031767FCC